MAFVEVEEKELAQLRTRADHQSAVLAKNNEVRKLKQRWDIAKDASLAAKKTYDEAVAELSELINEGPSNQLSLPFDGTSSTVEVSAPQVHWRERPLSDLNLTKAMAAKAIEAGINTVGKLKDVADGKVDGYPNGLKDIAGWKPSNAHRAETALSVLCGNEPDFTESPEQEEPAPVAEVAELSCKTEDDERVTIEILVDVPNGESLGLTKGAHVPAIRRGPNAQVSIEGKQPYLFMSGEYAIVTLAEPMIAENAGGFLVDTVASDHPAIDFDSTSDTISTN